MRRIFIIRNGWVTAGEFTEDWTLSRTTPGLTLIGLAALLGRRIDGYRGMVLALVGLLGPAALITALMAAGFAYIRDVPQVRSAIEGIAPATIGMTLAMMVIFTRSAVRPGRAALVDVGVLLAAFGAGTFVPDASIGIIVLGAVIGWLALGRAEAPDAEPAPEPVLERD
jgi:chromate transporter